MKPAPTLTFCLLALAALVAGCSLFSTPVERQEKTERKLAESDKALVREAQKENVGTKAALDVAPKSRAVDVAKDSAARTEALLAQANGPLPADEVTKRLAIVQGQLSDEQARRSTAEKALAAERATAAELSKANAALQKERDDAVAATKAWAIERDETAKKWERMWFWIYVAAGLYAASVALPILANIFPGVGALNLVSKAAGYIAAPALQFAKDRAVGGLTRIGHALEDFRQDAPEYAAKITRKFDSYTDADHQATIGAAAKDYRENLRPLEIRTPSGPAAA